ncbi:MAG: Ribosomal RNA large subunit methyltransferase F [Acidobacteria bacterium ADurb.Bin340]|nr:MAG: Ribosomal RNA large subunit methyltransferase F [Acidobacteria bacterium ADurb.Bin340]
MKHQPANGLHPRNLHGERYDLTALVGACPALGPFVHPSPRGESTVDFTDPRAVRLLNAALLAFHYRIQGWNIPEGFLCPPVPGRADHLHHLADLLGEGGQPPRGSGVRVLDIGTGASAIYPLLGHRIYGWTFVGTETNVAALACAKAILAANPDLKHALALRLQSDPTRIFQGVVDSGERFDLCLCNPPFHSSARAVRETAQTKWRKLGRSEEHKRLNFGGIGAELWCPGGELAFVGRIIAESAEQPHSCRWFSSLVSKSEHLPRLQAALREAKAERVQVLEMRQGQKRSRILAWSYSKG